MPPKGYKKKPNVDPERMRGLLRQCDEAQLSRDEKYVMFREAGNSHRKSRQLAGYRSEGAVNANQRAMLATIEQQREELRAQPGLTLQDSVQWYQKKSNGKKVATSDAIKARTRLDSLLGYDSPQKMEVSTRHDIRIAVGILQQLDLSPQDAARALREDGNG